MKSVVYETLRTLRVGAYFPLGWSLQKLQTRVASPSQKSMLHKKPLILVHGAFHNRSAFFELQQKLFQKGFSQVQGLELLTTVYSVDSLAEKLKDDVRTLVARNESLCEDPRAQLVAHSLGGIIVRRALQDPNFVHHVCRVIFLGTPHQGLKRIPWSFPSIRSLHAESQLLKSLREDPLAPGLSFWNLRGGLDVVTPLSSTFLPNVFNRTYRSVGHAGLLSSQEVLSDVVEILESPVYDPL
jgi:hypothetical protein